MAGHGLSTTKIYKVWASMMERCHNSNSSSYFKYGNKGITVCNKWHVPNVFIAWALLNGFDTTLTIERIDVTKGYSPKNCCWIPFADQAQNKGKPITNTSGYVGVSWHIQKEKWIARVTVLGKRIEVGRFDTALEGHIARGNYFLENNLIKLYEIYKRQHTSIK